MSLVPWLTPWKPATIAIAPACSACSIRPGVTSMILARPCAPSVITPAWLPVNERASSPRLPIAIASSAIEIRSPAVSSMSSSRGAGSGETCSARSISSSVVSPIADTTTTTSLPARRVSAMRWATRLTPAASATEEPPYFCTTTPTADPSSLRIGERSWPSLTRVGLGLRAVQHCGRLLDHVLLALDVGVEPVVADDRLERAECPAGLVAPVGDVGELPPPERLGHVARPEVAQAVGQGRRDAGQLVGQLGPHQLGVVRVEVVDIGVDAVEQRREPFAHRVEVGVGPDVGLELLLQPEVALGAEPGTGEQDLAHLEQQEGYGAAAGLLAGDRLQRDQVALGLVGDLLREVLDVEVAHGFLSSLTGTAPAREGPAERDLVGVLEITTHGQSTRQPGHGQPHRDQHPGEIRRSRVALDVRVHGQDDLRDRAVVEPGDQLAHAQLLGADAVERRDCAAEHVVAAPELAGALDRDHVLGLLDHADQRVVTARVAADPTLLLLGDIAAGR